MTETQKKTIIFIDGSYFCFHRYYSIVRWWKNARPEQQDALLNPYENEEFLSKFVKTFVKSVQDIPKNLGIKKNTPNVKIIVGKDCKREDIWRNDHIENYKANRKNGPADGFMGCPFFKMVHDQNLFMQGGAQTILFQDKLEADDCIAISAKHLATQDDIQQIYIITSDMDYLQLHSDKIKIFDLSFNNIATKKSSFGDAETNLFCKIVMGDKSDNIPAIFKKCGQKTALKCWQDSKYFEDKLKKENASEKYSRNRLIVDFNYIPTEYIDTFLKKYSCLLNTL